MKRFRTLARKLALLLLATAALRLLVAALPLIDPALSTATLTCDPCALETDAVRLLEPDLVRRDVRSDAARVAQLHAHLAQPEVKLQLFLAELIRTIPFALMFAGMAMALRELSRSGFTNLAIRWLRRAALSAIVWTVAQSVSVSVRWTALSEITQGRPVRHIILDPHSLFVGILISGSAWVVLWALEEAQSMQQDLDDYL